MISGRPRRVLTPIAPIATAGGVTLLLISLEVWAREVVLHLAGEADAKPPESTMAQLFGYPDASAHLSDDLGTRYRLKAGHAGGTDTEWRVDWYFTPGVPDETSTLTVAWTGEHIISTPITMTMDVGEAEGVADRLIEFVCRHPRNLPVFPILAAETCAVDLAW